MRELGAGYLTLETCQLVAEDDGLDVLRPLGAEAQDDKLEEAAERPVEEGESHVADPLTRCAGHCQIWFSAPTGRTGPGGDHGRVGEVSAGKRFRSYTGLAPRASETGETDRKGQPMSKAGPKLLRATLVRAADWARKQDPQLARIYYAR